jgi:hypothetical protein
MKTTRKPEKWSKGLSADHFSSGLEDLPLEPPEALPPEPLAPLEPFGIEIDVPDPPDDGAESLTKPLAISSAF